MDKPRADVALAKAMLLWEPTGDKAVTPALAGKVLVVKHPSKTAVRFRKAAGACDATWHAPNKARLLMLFDLFVQLTVRDGVDPKSVNDALCTIPEYRVVIDASALPTRFKDNDHDEHL